MVINGGYLLNMAWGCVRPLLDAGTVRKVQIYGSSFQTELNAAIDPAELPACLGGRQPALVRDLPVYSNGTATAAGTQLQKDSLVLAGQALSSGPTALSKVSPAA